jgi:2-polyprenyl-3-methyl-5-hydroxy-6-metoxy-1,4-benzoquinol methylase
MDLRERKEGFDRRHPWELSRIKAIRRIIWNAVPAGRKVKVLDVGCGDGFISRELFKTIPVASISAVDIHLSNDQIDELSSQDELVSYTNDYRELKIRFYELALMLDIIEHIKNDKAFLSEISDNYMENNGIIVITVPAFQGIYSAHDRFLEHHRRYSRKELLALIGGNNLECLCSGYLFISLLPIRSIMVFFEKYLGFGKRVERGVGRWNRGKFITKILESFLDLDNLLAISLARRGIIIPGLTVWALCRKPP